MSNTGRPTLYTEAIVDKICEDISKGIPLMQILREEGMPGRTTVYDWLNDEEYKDFSERFARARDVGFDAIAEETLDIADDGRNDWMQRNMGDEENPLMVEQFNSEHVQRSKLRIETRLKLLAKWNPKKYGDKLEVDLNTGITVDFRDAE